MAIIEPDSVVRADNYINKAEANANPANDAGRVPKLEDDGKISQYFLSKDFGDGSDGDVTIGAGTTTLTRDMYYNNLVITGTLVTDGWSVFVKNKMSGAGIIKWGTPNTGGNGHQTPTNGTFYPQAGTGATSSGSGKHKTIAGKDGGNGSVGSSGIVYASPGVSCDDIADAIGVLGGMGGHGGDYSGSSSLPPSQGGGTVGSVSLPTFIRYQTKASALFDLYYINGTTIVKINGSNSGSGGGGGSSKRYESNGGGGGGGGASGGDVFICARYITGTFTIESKGGNGGLGGNCYSPSVGGVGGGGGGGGGGNSIMIYAKKDWTGTYTLTGGIGGAKGTSGLTTSATNGSNGNNGNYYEIKIENIC